MPWRVNMDAPIQQQTNTASLAVDIDPQQRVVGLGLRRRSGGHQALFGNVIVRTTVPQHTVDWRPVVEWLHGEDAAALLEAISQGYRAEMVWSGDWVAEWSDDARTALQHLQDGIMACLEPKA